MKRQKTQIKPFRKFRSPDDYIRVHPLPTNNIKVLFIEHYKALTPQSRALQFRVVYEVNGEQRKVEFPVEQRMRTKEFLDDIARKGKEELVEDLFKVIGKQYTKQLNSL